MNIPGLGLLLLSASLIFLLYPQLVLAIDALFAMYSELVGVEDLCVIVNFNLYFLFFPFFDERVDHLRLVFSGDFSGSLAHHHIAVVARSQQNGAQNDRHVEAVSLLPSQHVARRGDCVRVLIRNLNIIYI